MKKIKKQNNNKSEVIEQIRKTIAEDFDMVFKNLLKTEIPNSETRIGVWSFEEELDFYVKNSTNFKVDFDFKNLEKMMNIESIPDYFKNRKLLSTKLKEDYSFCSDVKSARVFPSDHLKKICNLFASKELDNFNITPDIRKSVLELFDKLFSKYYNRQWSVYYDLESGSLSLSEIGNKLFVCKINNGFNKGLMKFLTEKVDSGMDYKTVVKEEILTKLSEVFKTLLLSTNGEKVHYVFQNLYPLSFVEDEELIDFFEIISIKKAQSLINKRSESEKERLLNLVLKILKKE